MDPSIAESKEVRVRTLTPKGQDLYQNVGDAYKAGFNKAWKEFEDILVNYDDTRLDIKYLREIEDQVENVKPKIIQTFDALMSFLSRTGTEESTKEMDAQDIRYKKCRAIIDNFERQIQSLLVDAAETLSEKYETRSEVTSHSTSSSSALLRKRVKANAQKVRLRFIERETQLQKQKAELEANLHLLEHQREVAALEEEVKTLENQESLVPSYDRHPPGIDEPVDTTRKQFTADYICGQTKFGSKDSFLDQQPIGSDKGCDKSRNSASDVTCSNEHVAPKPVSAQLNPTAAEFQPFSQSAIVSNLTQFLLKKDLLLSRFSSFNDRPDTYETWKASFTSIAKELNISAFEEMDLLVKWLGPESKKFASSIRASNVGDPARGLYRIWERLEERYGRPEMVEAALKGKLNSFPKISSKEPKKLYDLLDILTEIESAKENFRYSTLLSYFDSSSGVIPIVNKLPQGLQDKWASQAAKYKKYYNVPFPPFTFLVSFIRELSTMKNDPALLHDGASAAAPEKRDLRRPVGSLTVHTRKTNLTSDDGNKLDTSSRCPIHRADHSLDACRTFRRKSLPERMDILREKGLCYKCCSAKHLSRYCKANLKCETCGSSRHITIMHPDQRQPRAPPADGGERPTRTEEVSNKCTALCGQMFGGRSCAKIILVRVYPTGQRDNALQLYAVVDEQSNRTLARSEFFDFFNLQSDTHSYTLFSCSGRTTCSGRRASGFVIEAIDGSTYLDMPTIIECDDIPNNRQEIGTPEVAEVYPHLKEIASHLMPLDERSSILLLIGRDLGEAHHVLEQRIGPYGSPFAQKLHLGWVIVGEVCLGKAHRPDVVIANKVSVLSSGRSTLSEPCPSNILVKEGRPESSRPAINANIFSTRRDESFGHSIFNTSNEDDKPGLSVEDREFLKIMDNEFRRDESGHWVAPLPFRTPRRRLPNNKQQAVKRALMLDSSLKRNSTKREHAVTFMQRIIDAGHAELVPPDCEDGEIWYLPIFSVYHSKKPDQIRMVFDSSAQFDGVSLNKVLLSGPDLINSLLGVLLRFRMEKIGMMADIQQMFHCFKVREDHRNYLRFLWYANNDPNEQLVDYRMCVHVFGNSPSPAVAMYGLRRTAQNAETIFGTDVRSFVERNFYVDDGLVSLPSVVEAVSLMRRTQQALLQEGGLRLHKIASSSNEVMSSFPTEDLAKDLMLLDLVKDTLPIQRSLGLSWDLRSDSFTFRLSSDEKPYTRRGVLSCLNSFYDPLGFVAPVLIRGKLLLRKLMTESADWDQPLPDEYQEEWENWKQELQYLEGLRIPRPYISQTFAGLSKREVHVFTDASEEAIAAAAYLRTTDADGNSHQGFILGKAKVAPKSSVTIPRLELCAAVLGVEISEVIREQIDIAPEELHFHTDSKVVLGYIYNRTRRFYTYVSNRVEQIRKSSVPEQWSYVPSEHNPADQATRSVPAESMGRSSWLFGPSRWQSPPKDSGPLTKSVPDTPDYDLINSESDQEIRPLVTVKKTSVRQSHLGTHYFAKFSRWRSLVAVIACLKRGARRWSHSSVSSGCRNSTNGEDIELYCEAEALILREVQQESFSEELHCIRTGRSIGKDSPIGKLNPVLDSNGLLRVGGRLSGSDLPIVEKNPIIVPGKHHVATLLVRHYHNTTKHQGRHYTEGAIRSGGFWIIGAKRLISSTIFKCVTCRRLRRQTEHQLMADLPQDRLTPGPPFTNVGVDTFGPWQIITRQTRGGQAHGKRWAIMFSCLTSRAVHIEVVEEMSTSSFINALRRFVAIRGHIKIIRSDRGTNFIGSTDSLGVNVVNVEDGPVKRFLVDIGTTWIFNAPHSSHMAGAWERMIGLTRRIFDAILMDVSARRLTHETLTTFLAEASAIINSRPLVPVSTDPEQPFILTPYTLITQKTDKGGEPIGPFNEKDIYKAQWKRVQHLADLFWERWRKEYLSTLQSRRKWTSDQRNITVGNVVLMKDKGAHRCDWKMGIVERVFPSDDSRIRKVELRVNRDGENFHYTRPITEIVLLLPE